MRFSNRRVVVTGAGSGIGRATARLFAAEGAQVVIADISEAGLAETAAAIGERAQPIRYDAADLDSCRALIAWAAEGGSIDVLANVAGILSWGPTLDFDEARFERILRVNLLSYYCLSRAVLPHLVESGGNIVNVASTAALQGIAYTVAYSASKHGVVGMTKSLAVEFASAGVRINAVAPGHVDTPMGNAAPPEGDVDWTLVMRNAPKLPEGSCAPEDVAESIAFLASDKARKITGTVLTVDGGQLAG